VATPGGRPLKSISDMVVCSLSPHLLSALFFSRFNLGVAMVAMVAMPREYTEDDSR